MRKEVMLLLNGACWPGTSKYSMRVKLSFERSVTGQPPLLTRARIFAGWVLPFAAAPAEACVATVSGVPAGAEPLEIITLGVGGGVRIDTEAGAGDSKTGLKTGAGSGFFTGTGAGAGLEAGADLAAGFGAGFLVEAGFGVGFFTGAGFLAGGFFDGAAFLGAGFAAGFFAGAFLGAGFLAMVWCGG